MIFLAGMKQINNTVHDHFHRKGRKDILIGLYAMNQKGHREKWQSSAIPVTMYEKAAASRFRTRMTQIARIFTDKHASVSCERSAFYRIYSLRKSAQSGDDFSEDNLSKIIPRLRRFSQ